LEFRRSQGRSWHSPPHFNSDSGLYLVSASCFEHRPVIGQTPERMQQFSEALIKQCSIADWPLFAWAVLPNHYHLLLRSPSADQLIQGLGRLHGRTSFRWNGEDGRRGRQVWFNAAETGIKSERHFWAALLYVMNNPVKHGFVERWQEWPYSSAANWLESIGRERAASLWKEFPIDDFGAGWDPPDL